MYINNSRLVTWQSCNRQFALRYLMGLVPIIGSDALAFGSAGHEWLGTYYTDMLKGRLDQTSLEQQHVAFEETYRKLGNPTYADEFEPNLVMGHRLIDDYFNRDYILDDFSPVQVESQFVTPIGDQCYKCGEPYYGPDTTDVCLKCGAPVFFLVGRADLIAQRNDRLVVLDHKTAKGVGARTMEAWSHDFGLRGYAYGVTRTTPFKVTQFGVNIVKKLKTVGKDTKVCPDCRNGKRKHLTCMTCEQTGYVPTEPPKAFYRDYFRIDDQDIIAFERNRIRLCMDIVKEKQVFEDTPEYAYPMNCKSCDKFDKGCEFKDICWDGNESGKWWDIPASTLANFDTRDTDYVDNMVMEELE